MRLQEVYSICEEVNGLWQKLSWEEKKGPGNTTYHSLRNIEQVKTILRELDAVGAFTESIAAIRATSVAFDNVAVNANFDGGTKSKLTVEYDRLGLKVLTVVELFQSLNYTKSDEGFDIKLPANMSLSDLSRCTKDLDQIFSTCPLLSKQEGSVEFSAVDVGSVWLTFLVAGAAGITILKMLAELVDKAIIVRSHYLTAKEQEAKIRRLNMETDVLEETKKIHQKVGKALLENTCAELAKEHDISEPEDIERLEYSVKLLADWMERGLEIHAAVQAPDEIKAVFPPLEKQTLPEGVLALLTDGEAASGE